MWNSEMTYKYKRTPWRDEELMRDLYWGEGMSQSEIAEELDTTQKTVSDWMDRQGIETRSQEVQELRDDGWLREQYEVNERSTLEIADELDCTQRTVRVWLDKHGIETRQSTREKPPHFRTTKTGYEEVKSKVFGDTKTIRVHRLQAVAEYGFGAVRGHQVHHENHIPWDNRKQNLTLVTPSEHGKIHSQNRERDEVGNYA